VIMLHNCVVRSYVALHITYSQEAVLSLLCFNVTSYATDISQYIINLQSFYVSHLWL
jgi:hypothetical protein